MAKKPSSNHTLSLFGAWALAFGCIIGWGSFVIPGTSFLPNAGPLGTAIAMLIACVGIALIAANYHYMMKKYPVNGGAFVFALKSFGRAHGYACAWFLTLAYFSLVAQNSTALAIISRSLFSGFAEFGFSYTLAGYQIYFGEIVLAVTTLIICAYAIARSKKLGFVLQGVFATCSAVCFVVIAIAALTSPQASFANLNPAFSPDVSPLLGCLIVLALAPWAFIGFDAVSQTPEEFSFPTRKIGGVMIFAIVCGVFAYLTASFVPAVTVPANYPSWVEYIAATHELEGLDSFPVFGAAYSLMGPIGLLVLQIGALGAILSGVVGFYIATSYLLCAMGKAGFVPAQLSELHPKYDTPARALRIVCIASIALSLLGRNILSWIVDMSSIGAALSFLYTSAATYKNAHEEHLKPLIVSGVIGSALSLVFLMLLVVPIPQLGTSLEMESLVFLAAWIALGLNFFVPEQPQRKKIDLGMHITAIDSPDNAIRQDD